MGNRMSSICGGIEEGDITKKTRRATALCSRVIRALVAKGRFNAHQPRRKQKARQRLGPALACAYRCGSEWMLSSTVLIARSTP